MYEKYDKVALTAFMLAYFRSNQRHAPFEQAICDITKPETNYGDISALIRMDIIDDYLRDYLRRTPNATILNLGCGFCSRWRRFPNTSWIQVDLPQIIQLWYQLSVPDTILVPCDLHDFEPADFAFDICIAEGALVYLDYEKVLSLFKAMAGKRIIFDADNIGARTESIKRWSSRDLEPELNSLFASYRKQAYKPDCFVYDAIVKN